jgi:hypothetical protein
MSSSRTTAFICFDPRDPGQSIADRATWKLSDNAILISATMLLGAWGDERQICWDKVAALADLCEMDDVAPVTEEASEETKAMLRDVMSRAPPHTRHGRSVD